MMTPQLLKLVEQLAHWMKVTALPQADRILGVNEENRSNQICWSEK
jgi:hypothetical protein